MDGRSPAEDERVLWEGHPDPRRWITGADLFVIPFSVIWTAVGLDLCLQAPASGRIVFIPFAIASSLFLLLGRFLVKSWTKARTRYVLTSRRAILRGPRRQRTFDLSAGSPRVEVIRGRRHITLKFTSSDPRSYGRWGSGLYANTGLDAHLTPGRDTRFVFYDIELSPALDDAIDELLHAGIVAKGIA